LNGMENQKHNDYMGMALRLAFGRLGATSPNPAVGAVIVKNGQVVSAGCTMEYGGDHAEVVAIKNASCNLQGAEMYVTLEPCCHQGKTPPCTNAIIASGIATVYIPMLDPNPLVAGRGMQTLQQAGVEVVVLHQWKQAAFDIMRPFSKSIVRHKPFVIHKTASTLDGRTATHKGDSRWISSEVSRLLVHRLRSCVDTIVVGSSTVEADNPRLTVRYDDFSDTAQNFFSTRQYTFSGYPGSFLQGLLESWKTEVTHAARKVVIGLPRILHDTYLAKEKDACFFIAQRQYNTLSHRDDYSIIRDLMDSGRIQCTHACHAVEQIHEICDLLHNQGSMIVMLEGGAKLAGSFFNADAIDQCMYFYCPLIMGNGKGIIEGEGRSYINESMQLYDVSTVYLGGDVLVAGYKEPYTCEA